MPRYFINIFNDAGVDLHDDIGTRLDTRGDLRNRMISMALELMGDMRPDDWPWLVEALDESGKIVCSMDIGIEEELVARPVASGTIRDIDEDGRFSIRGFGEAENEDRPQSQGPSKPARRNGLA